MADVNIVKNPIINADTERHPFEPFLPENARILFLGSFPPQPHRWCMPFYYPNFQNDFWRIMGLLHFGAPGHFILPGEKRFDEPAICAFCTEQGLAFYDTACEVRRLKDNASDAFLEVVTPTDIPALLARIPCCRTIVVTGEKAAQTLAGTLGCTPPPVGSSIDIVIPGLPGDPPCHFDQAKRVEKSLRKITLYRMPSTSRAYPMPLERKAAAYRQLFQATAQRLEKPARPWRATR